MIPNVLGGNKKPDVEFLSILRPTHFGGALI